MQPEEISRKLCELIMLELKESHQLADDVVLRVKGPFQENKTANPPRFEGDECYFEISFSKTRPYESSLESVSTIVPYEEIASSKSYAQLTVLQLVRKWTIKHGNADTFWQIAEGLICILERRR